MQTKNLQPMKRAMRTVLLVLLLCVAGMTKANPVDMNTAREVAVKFMNANSEVPLRGTDDLRLVKTYNVSRGDAAFYVFNTPNGFVIVSADDCATPILGYSNEGQFDVENIPIQLQEYLNDFVEQIQYGIENQIEANEQTAYQWELVRTTGRLNENREGDAVEPLITALWDQGCYYNEKCPEDENGSCGHCVTGCVATAMAQIMHYWDYPEQGTGSYSYTPSDHPEYGVQYVNFGETVYDWANMPDRLTSTSTQAEIDAVSTLLWHCGVAVNMNYGPDGSGAGSPFLALRNYFNYSDDMHWENRQDDESWVSLLKTDLDLGRPIYYRGGTNNIGHAFVCDGYDVNGRFHFNWGWGGLLNGYYALNATLGFIYGHAAVFNICPIVGITHQVTASASPSDGGTVCGAGIYEVGSTCTLTASANEGYTFMYWTENEEIVSTQAEYSFWVRKDRNLVAHFSTPFYIEVAAVPEEGGMVNGVGEYPYGSTCILTASVNDGYYFICWRKADGSIISTASTYAFTVTEAMTLTAVFAASGEQIVFADPNVEAICVSHWDTNGDGRLSYEEAASVTYLGSYFENHSEITFFHELQWFTGLTHIDSYSFYNCSGLTSIVLPNSVTSIGIGAFRNCSGLNAVYYTGDIHQWCSIQFEENPSNPLYYAHNLYIDNELVTELVIPETVTEIKPHSFYGATCLTSLTISNSVTTIGDQAFRNCSGLTGNLTIPNSVTEIEGSAFSGCSGFTGNLTLPNSVTSIGEYAFANCTGFTGSLTIGNSVSTIGPGAFSHCTGFTGSLTIGNSVTSIGFYAFNDCSNFISMTVLADNPPTLDIDVFYNMNMGIPVFVPCESEEAFIAINWGGFNNIKGMCAGEITVNANPAEGGMVTGVGFYEGGVICTLTATASEGYSFINWTKNGTQVTSYADYNFVVAGDASYMANFAQGNTISFFDANVKNLCVTKWDINGDGELSYSEAAVVTDLGSTFKNKSNITSFDELQYFTGLTSIGSYSFYNCSGLTSIKIPNSVTKIENFAFSGCSGLRGDLTIPNSVTTIGNDAFFNCSGFTSLTIGNSVTSIGSWAFYNCSGFTGDLIIPNSVMEIGTGAFSGCSGFTGSLTIGNSVTSIGVEIFRGCNNLTSIIIPNSVTSIGNSAFCNCNELISIEIPNSVTSIGNFAFQDCTGLSSIEIPNSVTWLGTNPFSGCSGFEQINVEVGNTVYDSRDNCNAIINTSINELVAGCKNTVIPNSVTSIGSCAFAGYSNLASIEIPNSVTSIGSYAFQYCHSLTSIEIPNSVTYIGEGAFYSCSGLTSIEFPNSVTSINNCLFMYCTGLNSIEIPNSVSYIGRYAFWDCQRLSSMRVLADNPPTLDDNAFFGMNMGILVYVPCESTEAYTAANWGSFNNFIGLCAGEITVIANPSEGGTVTGGGYYEGGATCTLTATANDGYSFINWTKNGVLASYSDTSTFVVAGDASYVANFAQGVTITFADANVKALCVANWDTDNDGELSYAEAADVTDLGAVFRNNRNLSSFDELQYFTGLTSVGDRAFANCDGLTSIEIPNSVITISSYAFAGCGLTSIEIPNSVTLIYDDAFASIRSVEQIDVDSGNSVYDSRENCNAIIRTVTNKLVKGCKNTVIPNSVTSIGSYAFQNCNGLNSIEIPNFITSIESHAFEGCIGFTGSLIIPNSVSYIGMYAFQGCNRLTSVTIGNSVYRICYSAFQGCSGLTSMIVLANNPPVLEDCAFANVNKSIPVYVPCGSLSAYQTAAGWSEFTNIQEVCSQIQTVQLAEGTNWFSSNVEITLDDLKAALVEALPETTIKIKGKDNNTAYNPNTHRWNGTLTWDLSQMYKIQTSADCEITLQGLPIIPADLPITIVSGANWIAFPLTESMSLTNAFAGFAVNNDVIKSKEGTSQYKNGRWMGSSLTELQPGQGYIYKSAATGTRTFTYPTNAK